MTLPSLWLFPLSYAVHITEEALAGEGFPRWVRRVVGRELPRAAFLGINAVALAAMIVAVAIARTSYDRAWVAAALGTITLVNGVLHVLASVATQSYSPGAASGVVLWLPLGALAIDGARSSLGAGGWHGPVLVGLTAHLLVVVAAGVAIRRGRRVG
jgi:hypothetical protein